MGGQVVVQLIGVGVTACNVGVLTFIILELVDAMVGQRVSKQEEKVGLDMATHNERAYNLMKSLAGCLIVVWNDNPRIFRSYRQLVFNQYSS